MPNPRRNLVATRFTASLLCLMSLTLIGEVRSNPLPRPPSLEPAVEFWTRVFTKVDTKGGYVHDNRNLRVVYETLRFDPNSSPQEQEQVIDRALNRYRQALLGLAQDEGRAEGETERRIKTAWGPNAGARTFKDAAERVRFQRGQSDRFRKGLERAGAWEDHIQSTLRGLDLPAALAALPHVESSYNPFVRSHAGAAGLWQLTEPTAKRYLTVDEVVDERLDPHKSTEAAARFLKLNYSVLKSWPLAITAYNHGLAGIQRAVAATGDDDIAAIVQRYDGPRFGFASRNFYASFLAALDVSSDPETHFGSLDRRGPDDRHTVELPAYLPMGALVRELRLDAERLKALNPAIGPAVWSGNKYVPKGFRLRLPEDTATDALRVKVQRLARTAGRSTQKPDTHYKVKPGDTLSQIAARYDTNVSMLVAMNDLPDSTKIRAGRLLRVPSGTPVIRSKTGAGK